MNQDCERCGRTFRRQGVKSRTWQNPDRCPRCNDEEREAAVGRYCPSLIRERIHRKKVRDSKDAVARRLKTRTGLSA
ncbi:MAG: hypothetical protein OXN16_01505 [Gammaproteobacteria bacterium]|nr:hypothetical protein [Gammaproteobacteria bacterium]MDE0279747.1 hypothetical protein [Gammaproteobacteria bacterium]